MKIYTKTGDKGKTSLYGGTRISKGHARIESYGNTDELNSHLGLLLCEMKSNSQSPLLHKIQQQLFVIGSHLAAGNDHDFKLPEIKDDFIDALEQAIDSMNENLPSLKHFILPGGSKANAIAHVCRTVSRRAERSVVRLSEIENVDNKIIIYLNRFQIFNK